MEEGHSYSAGMEWYTAVGEKRGVDARCPFASVHRCPRYYESISLLAAASGSGLDEREDRKLLRKWKKSQLWPVAGGQAASIAGDPGNPSVYSNFCPEVTYEHFGIFAAFLARYGDEIDSGVSHAHLAKEGAPNGDWRWRWSNAQPMHFTECPLHSPLRCEYSSSGVGSKNSPTSVIQAALDAISNWPPIWRGLCLAILVLAVVGFALWKSFPEDTKRGLLSALFNGPADRSSPPRSETPAAAAPSKDAPHSSAEAKRRPSIQQLPNILLEQVNGMLNELAIIEQDLNSKSGEVEPLAQRAAAAIEERFPKEADEIKQSRLAFPSTAEVAKVLKTKL